MQAPDAVDDVVVEFASTNQKIHISAKDRTKKITVTNKGPVLNETAENFLNLYVSTPSSLQKDIRIFLAVPSKVGPKVVQYLRNALKSLQKDAAGDIRTFLKSRQIDEREALQVFVDLCLKQPIAKSLSDKEFCNFLRRVHIYKLDFKDTATHKNEAQQFLVHSSGLSTGEADKAWKTLIAKFHEADQEGLSLSPDMLRTYLAAEGISLDLPPDFKKSKKYLEEQTEHSLKLLEEHSQLNFPQGKYQIGRKDEAAVLATAARKNHVLLTGEPGVGKSGFLFTLVKSLLVQGIPTVLVLAEDAAEGPSLAEGCLPGTDQKLDAILSNWSTAHPGILVIDALDAVRDSTKLKYFRQLIRTIQAGGSGWRILASVRQFDLKYSRELREIFRGDGVEGFSSKDFFGVSHFHLERLTEEDVDKVTEVIPDVGPFITGARENQRAEALHRSPFFLRLVAELLGFGAKPLQIADWSTPTLLLRKFWQFRVIEEDSASERLPALKEICRAMVAKRSMRVSIQDLDSGVVSNAGLASLRSSGLILSPRLRFGDIVGGDDIRFSHHLFYDYAIGRSLIPATPDLVKFVAKSPELAIFWHQSLAFALDELWDTSQTRNLFWDTCIALEDQEEIFAVTRFLPPSLGARRVERCQDLAHLLKAVREKSEPAIRSLKRLASSLDELPQSQLLSSCLAWSNFAHDVASLVDSNPNLEPPAVHLLGALNPILPQLSTECVLLVSSAARNLLALHTSKSVANGWRYAAMVATETLCKSDRIQSEENHEAIMSLLNPKRVEQFPSWDLFDLAHQIQHLQDSSSDIVVCLFTVVFGTEPVTDERESLGGNIMPLNVSVRDNWTTVRYVLTRYYKRHSQPEARRATHLACVAWNAVIDREQDSKVIAEISLHGTRCSIAEDHGRSTGYLSGTDGADIVLHFKDLLHQWAHEGDSDRLHLAIGTMLEHNHTSEIWRHFLLAAAEHPLPLGRMLIPVFDHAIFLVHPDYSYAGIRLLCALHKLVGDVEKVSLEGNILGLMDASLGSWDTPAANAEWYRIDAQNKLLHSILAEDILVQDLKDLKQEREEISQLPENLPPQNMTAQIIGWDEEEMLKFRGLDPDDISVKQVLQFKKDLEPFHQNTRDNFDADLIDKHWNCLSESEHYVHTIQTNHPELAEELWGHVVAASEGATQRGNWPKKSKRWLSLKRILLVAVADHRPEPQPKRDDSPPSYGWPAPRVDAAAGLMKLGHVFGCLDDEHRGAIVQLSQDPAHAVRWMIANSVLALALPSKSLMWEIIDSYIDQEYYSTLAVITQALAQLWTSETKQVESRLGRISKKAFEQAPENHEIFSTLVAVHLFRHLRTGDERCGEHIEELMDRCDEPRVRYGLAAQLHSCRKSGWLTFGGPAADSETDEKRARTWRFFRDLLYKAQEKEQEHRALLERAENLGEWSPELDRVRDQHREFLQLIDGISRQLYFACGAFESKDDEPLTEVQSIRFWAEAQPLFVALTKAILPHTVDNVVKTLHHLLPHAPKDIFSLAFQTVRSGSEIGGFQRESLGKTSVVELVQTALADHMYIFLDEERLEELLNLLDLFVDAGWKEARDLSLRLQEIYR